MAEFVMKDLVEKAGISAQFEIRLGGHKHRGISLRSSLLF